MQLCIRVERDRQFDRLDESIYGAWHGALWSRAEYKLPEFKNALPKRRERAQARSFEQEMALWEIFFGRTARTAAN